MRVVNACAVATFLCVLLLASAPSTALATMTLEIYYQHLSTYRPVYRGASEPDFPL